MATLFGDSTSPIVEALISGAWTDISSRVRDDGRISIQRGRANEQARITAHRANLTLDNADGYFSTRVPSSVNYRKMGRNTQVRVRAGSGGNHLRTLFNDLTDLAGATTTDKASLDITGDIDIRVDISPHSWRPRQNMMIVAKYAPTGNQRSWALRLMRTGKINFTWSIDGTSTNVVTVESPVITIPASGRLAVRLTLDVNNGGGGWTLAWMTSSTIDGTWTTLTSGGSTPTTSIYASTAVLAVARGSETQGIFTGTTGFGGQIHAVEVRNGIAGTLVADFDPRSRSIGDTSWSDGLASPNTWTVAGTGARVTSDRVRIVGELASIPKRWDKTGTDVTAPVQVAGALRRLGQGSKPISSAMYRNFNGVSSYAWWPLEDGQDATSAANAASGESPRARTYSGRTVACTFGATEAPPGAKSSLAFQDATSQLYCRGELLDISTTVYSLVFYVKLAALPATDQVFCSLSMFGQLGRVDISLGPANWTATFYDITGVQVATSATSITSINPVNGWVGYNLLLKNSGASDMTYSQRWDTIGTFGGGVGPTTISAFQPSPPTSIKFMAANDAAYQDMNLSHVFISNEEFDLTNDTFRNASNAYRGETAAARLYRLAAEEGEVMELTGVTADSETMGYQTLKTYADLVAECWDVDGGIGGDARDVLALEYRVRSDIESRSDLTLNYSDSDLADVPEPADDDLNFTNDATVTRTGGSSARVEVGTGYTSVLDPPSGVGRYQSDVTLNCAEDDRLPSIAGWIALTGSWDQDRYPSVAVALHRSQILGDDALFTRLLAANLGDTLTLTSLPSWMPPDDVPELIQGYAETISHFLWEIDFNCSPAGPFQAVPVLGDEDVFVPRLDANEHTSSGALTTTATSVTLVTPAGSARWVDSATYPGDFPMDLVIGGEVVRLTAVTGTSSPQTGTITRSINGVVKSHSAGAAVRLARPFYVGR